MTNLTDDRLTRLEDEIRALSERLGRVERAMTVPPPRVSITPTPPAPRRAPAEPASVLAPAAGPDSTGEPVEAALPREQRSLDIEEVVGGRILALVGGAAVVLGLAFLVALAAERGWLDARARVTLAFAAAGAVFAAGAWLSERRGRTQASLAMVGTGIAGLYVSLAAATSLYDLAPVAVALVGAFAVGAAGAYLALRWASRTLAGLGILGALASPVLVDAFQTRVGILFLAVALAAAVAVLVWRQWQWLRLAAFAIAMGQVAFWALEDPSPALVLAGLSVFGILGLAAAVGHDLRARSGALVRSTALLAAANALVVTGIGFAVLEPHGVQAAGWWTAAVALGHLGTGIVVLRARRGARSVALLLFGVALASADVAFAQLADGPAVAIGWALGAAGLATLARRYSDNEPLVQLTLGGQLALAIGHTLLFDAPVGALVEGADGASAYPALAAIGVSAFACARLARRENDTWRYAADLVSAAALAYATALALDGVALVLAWVSQALAIAELARRMSDQAAAAVASAFLGLAVAHALAFEASPEGLVYGADSLVATAVSLAVVAAAFIRLGQLGIGTPSVKPSLLYLGAGAVLVYLVSLAIVTAFQPGPAALDEGVGFDVRQRGQALLSAFWALCGLVALAVGLARGWRVLRLAAFALLAIAVAKVFLYDMATLEAGWRVLSFVALGLLLLVAAFAYQRTTRAGAARGSPASRIGGR